MSAEDVLRRLPGDPATALEIATGTEHWRAGEVTLIVDGSGAVCVRHRHAGQEDRYAATLDVAQLDALVRRLDELGFGDVRPHARDYRPDEMTVTVALRRDGEIVSETHRPEDDRYKDERFAAVMREYERLVERVTDGALPHGDAAAPR